MKQVKAEAPFAVELCSINSIHPYEKNPRLIPHAAVEAVAHSLLNFGFRQPIVVDQQRVIVAGHTRYLAALQLGLKNVPVHIAALTPEQVQAYRIADNSTNTLSDWNLELLQVELGELSEFRFEEFGLNMEALTPPKVAEDDFDINAAIEAIHIPKTERGDMWTLGRHRLVCDDATKREDIARLMNGTKADIVFTDPPYGVNYCGGAKKRKPLMNDDVGTVIYMKALPLIAEFAADYGALYLWYADAHAAAAAAAAAVAVAGYIVTAQIIWVKNNAQFMTAAHYHGKHEPCFYAHKKGKTAAWYGPDNEVTVWEVARSNKNEFHPTQKPVELAGRALRNSSRNGSIVLDPFSGSGSTLIAAEQMDRVAYLMEIDPLYCDVIVERWEQLTGQYAQKNKVAC